MKYLVFFASVLVMGLSGCMKADKGCTPVEPSAEDAQMKAYINNNGITAIKHNSGMYYQVLNPGTGATPLPTSKVFVTYTGKFLSGAQFDQSTTPISFFLNQVIEGWQIGVPLIKKGGKIKLIVPSTYAYGCNGSGSIPPNSILVFDIDLIDVQ